MSKDIKQPIILIGLMGAGKTTLGRALAAAQNRGFIDVDHMIEQAEGRSIPDIFTHDGEPHFRKIEKNTTIESVKNNPNTIISIGGGAFMNEKTRTYIREHALSVFIKADLNTLLTRVGEGEGRPLLKNNPEDTLQSLIDLRYPIYETADIIVDSKIEPLEETVQRVTDTLYNAGALS